MSSSLLHRRRGVKRATIVLLTFGTVAAHASVIAVADATRGRYLFSPPTELAQADVEWTFTCEADAAMAAGLRLAACATPFAADAASCARDVLVRLDAARAACGSASEVQVAFVDVDKLDLMPVPLLDDVKPKDEIAAAQLIQEEVAKKVEEAQRKQEQAPPTGQVVEITRPTVEEAPDNARFRSEYDSKAEKQTVARASTEEMVARPSPSEIPAAVKPPEATPAAPTSSGRPGEAGNPAAPEPKPSMLAMREERPGPEAETPALTPGERKPTEMASIDGLKPPTGLGGEPAPPTGQRGGGPAGGDGGTEATPKLDLRPNEKLLERAVGGGSVDHIDDAETGDFTALNSKKWRFAGFFNRMKRQVAQNWHPDDVYVRRDPSGNVYGTKDRITVLQVSLTPTGSVAKVFVAQQSGVDFLDEEAIRAFREAQPFPNPPTGLVDQRSNLITFSFGFHFQIGGDSSTWRVFRAQ